MGMAAALAANINAAATIGDEINTDVGFMALAPFYITRAEMYPAPARTRERAETPPKHRADLGLSQPGADKVQFAEFKLDSLTKYNHWNSVILSGSVKHPDTECYHRQRIGTRKVLVT